VYTHAIGKPAFSGLLNIKRNGILIIAIDRARENGPVRSVAQVSSKRLYSVDPVCG
jgi:hypothetical protein